MVIISMKKHSALGEKNKNTAGLRFSPHPSPSKSAVVAAASSASLKSCCRIPLTGRLSGSSTLLQPTFYLCILWTFDCGRRPIPMLHCTMFVYVTDAQDNAGPSSLCSGLIFPLDSRGSNISINQNAPPSFSLFLPHSLPFRLHAKVI